MKVWELKKWDKWQTKEIGVVEFIKMDWMYGQWMDERWYIVIWHNDNYEYNYETKMYE